MSVVDQAENVGGIVSAARMRERFRRERKNTTDEERQGALGDAIGTIEMRFPELEDLPAGGAEKFARERGHGRGSRSPSHEGRKRPGAGNRREPDAAPLEHAARRAGTAPSPKRSQGGGSRKSSPASSGGGGRGRTAPSALDRKVRSASRRAIRDTGIPAAASSTTQIAMSVLGATVGLSILYLLLTSAEKHGAGKGPLPEMLEAISGFLRRVIAPVDFFGPTLDQAQYRKVVNRKAKKSLVDLLPEISASEVPPRFPRVPGVKTPTHSQRR